MSELKEGDALGPWRFDQIEPDSLREMAVVLDDPNPIHLDAAAVAAIGLGDRQVNQGPSNIGYMLNMLGEIAPGARVEKLQVRFLSNVFAGDIVVAAGTVDSVDGDRISCSVWLEVEGGTRAVEGQATVATKS
jgi:acyl dehydratase